MRRLAPFALLAALGGMTMSACSTTRSNATDLTPEAAQAFVVAAASSDMFEIESSRLALQRSQDPRIRAYAEMMIRDHTNMSSQLRAAATEAGVGLPTQMLPMHEEMIVALERAANFDATYRQQQEVSHERTLRLMDNYARRGDVPRLRGVAAAAVPVVRGHLEEMRGGN